MVDSIVGQVETVELPEVSGNAIHARIDTGAKTSAVWASSITETERGLEVVFFDKGSEHYTESTVVFSEFDETVVASSNGQAEHRYKVRLLVVIGGRRIRAWFTLANRSQQVYPVLIGRNVLRGKFMVDVSRKTHLLTDAEKQRTKLLQQHKEQSK